MPSFSQKFIGMTLPIRLGQTGMFEQSLDIITQTRSNVKNLILTKKGERLNQPKLGCDIWKVLFEPLTPTTVEKARISVVEAFDAYLPYLEVVDFTIQQLLPDENLFSVTIVYRFLNNPNVVDVVELTTTLNTEVATPMVTTRASEEYITRVPGSTSAGIAARVIRSGVRGTALE